jgi:hypothetical protein
VSVVDERGRPVRAAVYSLASFSRGGSLPESRLPAGERGPKVESDWQGHAVICDASAGLKVRTNVFGLESYVVVEPPTGWPEARTEIGLTLGATVSVTVGPSRAIELGTSTSCGAHTSAQAIAPMAAIVWAQPLGDRRVVLAGLGPWRYWVQLPADCGRAIRLVDGRRAPEILTMDRSEALLEAPDFAGGRASVSSDARPASAVARVDLDPTGEAVLPLPLGGWNEHCVRLERGDRWMRILVQAGRTVRVDPTHPSTEAERLCPPE